MKLNKKILKNLIMESLEEMHGGEHTGTGQDDVTYGRESELQPEMSDKSLEDISLFFAREAEKIRNRIASYKPSEVQKNLSEEDIRSGIEEMEKVQGEAADIIKELEKIKLMLVSPKPKKQ
jgi:hypothetical protein